MDSNPDPAGRFIGVDASARTSRRGRAGAISLAICLLVGAGCSSSERSDDTVLGSSVSRGQASTSDPDTDPPVLVMPYDVRMDGLIDGVAWISQSGCAYIELSHDGRNFLLAVPPGTSVDLEERALALPAGGIIRNGMHYELGGGTLMQGETALPEVAQVFTRAVAACEQDGVMIARRDDSDEARAFYAWSTGGMR